MTDLIRLGSGFDRLRSRFPILAQKTYLASHSLGAVPTTTANALLEYHSSWAELGILAWDGPWWAMLLEFNRLIETLLHAAPGTVVPMENVTRGMAAIASCLDFRGPRNKVVMTDLEFITSYPFWQGVVSLGAELVIVEAPDGMHVPTEKLIAAIDERTLIVPTSHVYFRSGALQDLASVTEAAHKKGAYVLGDGYQCVGTVPVDVASMNIDFYVGGSHKWLCGGPGAGFLYVRPDLIQKLTPRLSGWFGVKDPFDYQASTIFPAADGVFRFLGGTPSIASLYAAREGIRAVIEAGIPAIREYSQQMTSFIIDQADRRGLSVRSPRSSQARSGMVCLEFEGSRDVAEKLVKADIIVDWRPNCGIRVSPHFYNLEGDLRRFFEAFDEITGRKGA